MKKMNKLVKKSLLLALALVSSAQAAQIEFSIGTLTHDPSGTFQWRGTNVNLDDDLGLRRTSRIFIRGKVEHNLPCLPNLYLQYMPSRFSGEKVLTREIIYGNRKFSINATVSTSAKLDRYDIGLYSNLKSISRATKNIFNPEVGVNIRVFDFQGTVTGNTTTGKVETVTKKAKAPIPMPYLASEIKMPQIPLSIRAELRTIPVSKLRYYDLIGEIKISPVKQAYVSLGYHYEKFKLDNIANIYTDLENKGLYVMLGIKF